MARQSAPLHRTGRRARALCAHRRPGSDIYELYCLAEELGTGFLVRSCVDRLAEDGDTTISMVMAQIPSSGTHEVRFRDAHNQEHRALLIIHAEEMDSPEGRAPVFLEADHEPAGGKPCAGCSQAWLVCAALENRNLLQDPEDRLPD